MKTLYINTLLLFAVFVFSSCAKKQEEKTIDTAKTNRDEVALYVDTLHLKKQIFQKQIVCNGKLRAILKSELQAKGTGQYSEIKIQNGDVVRKNQLLAVLDKEDAEIALAQATRTMDKASLDLIDRLTAQGYQSEDSVPEVVLKQVKHASNYYTAEDQKQKAERDLADCFIYAPFSGRVANLNSKMYDMVKDPLCTLIDDRYFDVEFNILEAELPEVSKGQKIIVSPFINEEKKFEGVITQINPLVDDKGQIQVRAKVVNQDSYLVEGMNVKLVVNREISNQFVVPKNAVVLRDGFHVIFLYVGGEAVWTYVEIVMSNIDSHLIKGHKEKQTTLSEDDIVITSGNRNIADGIKVNIK